MIKPFAKLLSTAVKIGKENILNECEREKEKELVSYCANFYQKNHLFWKQKMEVFFYNNFLRIVIFFKIMIILLIKINWTTNLLNLCFNRRNLGLDWNFKATQILSTVKWKFWQCGIGKKGK